MNPTQAPRESSPAAEADPLVWLVGAGPGDPELMTVLASRLLSQAEVVVHDALVGTGVLELAPASAEIIDVGKRPGQPVPQREINELLVRMGRDGRRTVRIKGGDPFIFGRGGEEAAALAEAGIAYGVVPGISSAIAAPMAAGVPVTYRGTSATLTIVTGHRRSGEEPPDWEAMARLVLGGGTLVVLMGVAERAVIASALLNAGAPGELPVAITRHATTARQTVQRCRLDQLAVTAVSAPAVMVIGSVAAIDMRPFSMGLQEPR